MPKYNLIILDTETTGLRKKDRICQLAFKENGKMHSRYFDPMIAMTKEAQEVNKIDEEMLKTKMPFRYTPIKYGLIDIIKKGGIIVAHNAVFDIGMLKKEGVKVKRHICTKHVSKWLYPSFKSHRLQDLKTQLGIEGDFDAHNAVGDVKLLNCVLEEMIANFIVFHNLTIDQAIKKMMWITKKEEFKKMLKTHIHSLINVFKK